MLVQVEEEEVCLYVFILCIGHAMFCMFVMYVLLHK